MPTGIKPTQETVDNALARLAAGEDAAAIGKSVGVRRQTIYVWKRKAKKRKPDTLAEARRNSPPIKSYSKETKAKAIKLLEAGKSASEVAKAVGTSIASIYTWKWKQKKTSDTDSSRDLNGTIDAPRLASTEESDLVNRMRKLDLENGKLRAVIIDLLMEKEAERRPF